MTRDEVLSIIERSSTAEEAADIIAAELEAARDADALEAYWRDQLS